MTNENLLCLHRNEQIIRKVYRKKMMSKKLIHEQLMIGRKPENMCLNNKTIN